MSLLRFARLAAIGIIAAVALASAVSTAGAMSLSFENPTLTSSTGVITLSASGITITCDVTLGTAPTSTIAKVAGTPIETLLLSGAGSSERNCGPLVVEPPKILPGAVLTYLGFTGPLPGITKITAQALNAGYLIRLAGIGGCLYTGTLFVTYNRNAATLLVNTIAYAYAGALSIALDGANCPALMARRGTLTPNPKPRVRLI